MTARLYRYTRLFLVLLLACGLGPVRCSSHATR